MKALGYVNRFSRGVYRVQKELGENGNGKASLIFGRTEDSIRHYLRKLTKAGIIKREGAKKNGKWVVVDREELEK